MPLCVISATELLEEICSLFSGPCANHSIWLTLMHSVQYSLKTFQICLTILGVMLHYL